MKPRAWQAATKPGPMLTALPRAGSERGLRFFALHCCRLAWVVIGDARSRAAVEAAERFLIGHATADERHDALREANAAREEAAAARVAAFAAPVSSPAVDAIRTASLSASIAAHVAYHAARAGYYDGMLAHVRDALAFGRLILNPHDLSEHLKRVCALLRELFPCPAWHVSLSHTWRTDTAVSLARHMYETCDFSAMPILADALQDAGCDSEPILAHCRDPLATHVRGCWVVDLVLGKA